MLLPTIGLLLLSTRRPACCCGGDMTQFASDPAFLALHLPPKAFKFKARSGYATTFKDANGKDASGFYVQPNPGSKVALVMIHEFWGLNGYIKQEAEKIHDSTGYGV